jgi:excisionase family DNA binding protein
MGAENLVMAERWLSEEEIAAHLGVSTDAVYKWIYRKKMPAHKLGRLWKFLVYRQHRPPAKHPRPLQESQCCRASEETLLVRLTYQRINEPLSSVVEQTRLPLAWRKTSRLRGGREKQ